MAERKLKNNSIEELLIEFDNGKTPANLAVKYGVHPSTLRRYLRVNGRKLGKIAHSSNLDSETKIELKRILVKYNVKNLDSLISELDESFNLEIKESTEDADFPIIDLKGEITNV